MNSTETLAAVLEAIHIITEEHAGESPSDVCALLDATVLTYMHVLESLISGEQKLVPSFDLLYLLKNPGMGRDA